MALRFYTACIEGDDGPGFSAFFPDLPGCVSAGETVQQAAENAAGALALHVEGMLDAGEGVPEPSAPDAPLPDWLSDVSGQTIARVLVPVDMPGHTARLNITLDEGLLSRLDSAAAAEGMSRSGFIAQAVRDWLRRPVEVA